MYQLSNWTNRNHFLIFLEMLLKFDGLHSVSCASDSFTEQLELQFLSDELDIAITDHGENPWLEEIYEKPQVPTKPTIGLTCNQSCHSVVPTLDDLSSQPSPWLSPDGAEYVKKFAISSTVMKALKVLLSFGCVLATPKGVLKHMHVEGLTVYHVKSHLQRGPKGPSAMHRRKCKKAGIALIAPPTLSSLTNPCQDFELRPSPSAGASPTHPAVYKMDSSSPL
ncbi:myb family transcription factor phl6 [Quercus suber]|uniref:Myb family transcription factor phl6 n=1 Tax=Quercus suber TaxID=58331 RepID=A0AAW0J3J0_QUESU